MRSITRVDSYSEGMIARRTAQPGGGSRTVRVPGGAGRVGGGLRGRLDRLAWIAALAALIGTAGLPGPGLALAQSAGAERQGGAGRRITLPGGTLAVKAENGYAVAQVGARRFLLIALDKQPPEEREVAIEPQQLGVFSFSVEDFSISPDRVLYVAAYANFGLGDSRYALIRYSFQETDGKPEIRHLPDVRCRHLGAGLHGVWCLDPEPREMRNEPPTLTWIAFLGAVRRYALAGEPGQWLGPAQVVVARDDVAETWLPSLRLFVEAHPSDAIRAQAPIPVDPASRALTSFAVSPGGKIQALLPLRENGVELLTTPYALAELNAQRNAWRRLLPGRRFERGSRLAGWSATQLWLWNRATHGLETIGGVAP